MHIGTLHSIWRFPMKSMRGESLQTVDVGAEGLDGDRTGAFVVRAGGPRVGKLYRGKEDDALHLQDDAGRARTRASERGFEIEPLDGERFFDDAPVSLIVDRWLDGLRNHLGYAIEPERFRPNFVVCASAEFGAAEPDLTGRMIGIGGVRLRVRYPIERCVVPNYDLHGGPADARVLRYLAAARNAWMGIYCDVLREGAVRVDESVDVIDA